MKFQKNRSIKNCSTRFYFFGIILICGFLLISADDCESTYLAEQQRSMEQRARAERERIAAANNSKSQSAGEPQSLASTESGTTMGNQSNTGGTASTSETQTNTGGSTGTSGSTVATGTQSGSNNTTAASGNQTTPGGSASTGGSTVGTGTQSGSNNTTAASGNQTASGGSTGTGGSTVGTGTQSGTGGSTAAPGTQPPAGGIPASSETPAIASGTNVVPQGSATGSTGGNYMTSISGKNWKLTELHFINRTVLLNRSELSGDQADFFTMTIDNERISGRAAPNRYFTSYQANADNTLTIQPIASTMMALIVTDPQRIQEHEYFQYLGKVKSWKINQNKLELTTTDAANRTLIMVFSN